MEKDKRLKEASRWERLRGKLGLVLVGRAMLRKTLIQFSIDGWVCVPSLLFTWGQTIRQCQRMLKLPHNCTHLTCSFQFSRSVVSESLRRHELQHTRPSSPSPTPGVHPNSCPLSQWCNYLNTFESQSWFVWVSRESRTSKTRFDYLSRTKYEGLSK